MLNLVRRRAEEFRSTGRVVYVGFSERNDECAIVVRMISIPVEIERDMDMNMNEMLTCAKPWSRTWCRVQGGWY